MCHPFLYDERQPAADETLPAVEETLVRLFTEVRPRLLQKLRTLLGNDADANDAAQTAFLHCWRARKGLDCVRNVRGWIWRVGVNAGRDLRKSRQRRRSRYLEKEGEEAICRQASPSETLLRQEQRDRLRAALIHLQPAEREVFLLRHDGELTYQEIAQHRGCSVGTAKPLMHSAMHKLRRILHDGSDQETN